MFIGSSSDASFQFQRCPANMACLNGGPPVPLPVSAVLTLSGHPAAAAAWSAPDMEAVRQAVRAGACDAQLQVELTEVCFPDGTCQALAPYASSGQQQRRAQTEEQLEPRLGQIAVRFQTGAPGRSSEALKAKLESQAFCAGFEASMAARGIPVESAVATQALQPLAEGVGVYALVGAAFVLKACPIGFLLVNASLDEQECAKCPAGQYSLNPVDGCVEGLCRLRDCTMCPNGATCAGGSRFAAKAHNSTWEVVWDSNGYSKKRLVGCAVGSILVRNDALAIDDECVTCPFGKYSLVRPAYPIVLSVDSALLASEQCLLCKPGLQCHGGNHIAARQDYWLVDDQTVSKYRIGRSARTGSDSEGRAVNDSEWTQRWGGLLHQEALLVPCPPKACREGGLCSEGHEGPVCG
eukprot:2640306-Rhodomonas_salina.2